MRTHKALVLFACCAALWGEEAEQARLKAAAYVLTAILGTPDKGFHETY